MKFPIFVILSILLFGGFACRSERNYNQGYKKGYDKGFMAGSIKGTEEGFERGLKDGYEKGYGDAFKEKHKDLTIVDLNLKQSVNSSRKFFTVLFFIINVLALLGLLIYLLFLKDEELQIRIAKVAYLLMSTAIAYLSISAFSINDLVNPPLHSFSKWFTIVATAPITFGISLAIRKVIIKLHIIYSDILAIFFATFVLTYFVFFLINLELFLLHNELTSYCVISMSAGGLAFAGYTIIDISFKTVRR